MPLLPTHYVIFNDLLLSLGVYVVNKIKLMQLYVTPILPLTFLFSELIKFRGVSMTSILSVITMCLLQ